MANDSLRRRARLRAPGVDPRSARGRRTLRRQRGGQIRGTASGGIEARRRIRFDIRVLIGGQLERDREHRLYLVYPEGNWVEIGEGTPYHIIGASGYGKPVLDRTLKFDDDIRFALKVGCLAFDSTRISAADVDFPVDIVVYERDRFELVEHRYEKDDLAVISNWWQDRLRRSVPDLPVDGMEPLLPSLPKPAPLRFGSAGTAAPSG